MKFLEIHGKNDLAFQKWHRKEKTANTKYDNNEFLVRATLILTFHQLFCCKSGEFI